MLRNLLPKEIRFLTRAIDSIVHHIKDGEGLINLPHADHFSNEFNFRSKGNWTMVCNNILNDVEIRKLFCHQFIWHNEYMYGRTIGRTGFIYSDEVHYGFLRAGDTPLLDGSDDLLVFYNGRMARMFFCGISHDNKIIHGHVVDHHGQYMSLKVIPWIINDLLFKFFSSMPVTRKTT